MEKENLKEKREKVLNEFVNTKKHIRTIAKENDLPIQEVYAILEEYNESNELQRPRRKSFPHKLKNETEETVTDLYEKIYNLRKQKKSYRTIAKEIGMSPVFVSNKCKEIFKEKGENEPKTEYKSSDISNQEKIYNLRKQKKSYQIISEETGIKKSTVRFICKKIYDEKGEEIPGTLIRKKTRCQTEESKRIDEMIYNLVQQGKKYEEVKEELNDIGISMSNERIRQRCERKILQNEQELAKAILNLTITRKATIEQVKQIADYYGVDLEKTMNSLEER